MTNLSYDPEISKAFLKVYKSSSDNFDSMQFVRSALSNKQLLASIPDESIIDLIMWCTEGLEARQAQIAELQEEMEELDTFQVLMAGDERIVSVVLSETEIEALGLSSRSYQILKNAGISNLQDLREMTADKVRALSEMSDRSYLEITTKLGEWGVSLKENITKTEEKILPP